MSHRLTRSTKVYVDREGENSTLKRLNASGVVMLGSDKLCDVGFSLEVSDLFPNIYTKQIFGEHEAPMFLWGMGRRTVMQDYIV